MSSRLLQGSTVLSGSALTRTVEIDQLIAPQRTVNLDHVEATVASLPTSPTMAELIRICLSSKGDQAPIQHLETGLSSHVFSSPNPGLRVLGAFIKPLTPEDLDYAALGGLPAAAIITLVGYGVPAVNVLEANGRLILNNGFHRAYALRSVGIKEIPVVVQHLRNVELEFSPSILDLPRDYLLEAPRPVLMKDFFEPDFSISLKVRQRLRMVSLELDVTSHDVPA